MQKNILLIDDDEAIHKQISASLKKNRYNIISVYSGNEGLRILKSEQIDLIILDYFMPGLSGMETFMALREGKYKYTNEVIPVIMLTGANHSAKEVTKILESGINAYLDKPFGGKELLNVIRNILVTSALEPRKKLLHRAIENSKNFLENLVDSCPILILTTNKYGKITFVNRVAKQFFGSEPNELTGKPFTQFLPAGETIFKDLLENNPQENYKPVECQIEGILGHEMTIGINYSFLKDKNNNLLGLLAVCQDLSAHKQLVAEQQEKTRLGAIAESLATINHQINNPLMPILGNIQLIKNNETRLAKDDLRKLDIIEINAKKILQIIRKFNQFKVSQSVKYYGASTMLELK